MNQAKVQFSKSEMDLMCDSEIILTKNKVLEKVKAMLEDLQEDLVENQFASSSSPHSEIFSIHPKISKGENYLGLPYLILDFPRVFKQQDIFAIRTMFWWGNFYSTTLHLSGDFKLRYLKKIQSAQPLLSGEGFYLGIGEDPWKHHFGDDNYVPISLLDEKKFSDYCTTQQHLKIARTTLLDDDDVAEKLMESWQKLARLCLD